jgi:hypothetical protein
MSFGGTTAVQTCTTDARCVAGANIDGFQVNLINQPPLEVPFLIVSERRFEWQRVVIEKSRAPAYLVRISDTQHANFTDLALLSPLLQDTPLLGAIDPNQGLKLLNLYVKAFFDIHLLHKDVLQKGDLVSIKTLADRDALVRLDAKNIP